MNWTSTPPTTPGDYAWRLTPDDAYVPADVVQPEGALPLLVFLAGDGLPKHVSRIGGQWCKLVPAEEIKLAWDEGYRHAEIVAPWKEDFHAFNWSRCHSKRVMEGLE